jgi:mRNA interferase RelE/StbE
MIRYKVHVTPTALAEVRALPGHMRQRVRRAIDSLAEDARPADSKQLEWLDWRDGLWRVRLDRWRILYLVDDTDRLIDVIAVRRRPPYDYGDLERLLEDLA